MIEPVCDICGNPTDGYCCSRCTDETARYLRHVVDLAGEVETNVARLARYATHDGRRAPQPDEEGEPGVVNRSQPVTVFGFQASKERQLKNALRAEPLPVDLNASARAAYAFNDVMTWAQAVEKDRGHPIPDVQVGEHPAAVAATYLLAELGWMRLQRFAAEAFDQLKAAGAVIRRIVDRPPDLEIVGVCDCGEYLYAYEGAATVTCPNRECGLRWDVATSRQKLWDALPGYLTTASEAALLLMLHAIGNQDRRRWAKTITMRASRGLLVSRGEINGVPVYLFGDVMEWAVKSTSK